jgi:hypothetical protein
LRIFGKIVRTVLPNDKLQILNDKFVIQAQRFGCGLPRCGSVAAASRRWQSPMLPPARNPFQTIRLFAAPDQQG